MSAAVMNLMDCDLFRAMESGELLWGDLLMDHVPPTPAEDLPRVITYTLEEEMLDNWEVPDLSLRKGIWENFPVAVVPIAASADGTERYSIVWHRKNLTEWRSTRPRSVDEAWDYQFYCEWRLMYALKQYAHKYDVEPARNESEICVIAMVHAPATEGLTPVAEEADEEESVVEPKTAAVPSAPAPAPRRRALDVLRSFPVSWDRDGSAHYIKIHNKNIQALAASKGKSVSAMTSEVHADLLDALATCVDCVVSAKPGYLCAVLLK